MSNKIRMALLATGLAMASGIASAAEQTLECKLYIAESLDHASTYAVESTGSLLNGVRRAGICVFADGSVADKQFVMGMNIRDEGSAGDAVGISVYTFESGDSLTLSFTGGWDKGPFAGEYTVLSGTGAFQGATGTGTISGVDGPWNSTTIVDIRIDVMTAGS